jgi:hypothetical protein
MDKSILQKIYIFARQVSIISLYIFNMQTYENHNDIEFQANFLLINFGVHLAYVRSIANIEPQLHHVPRIVLEIFTNGEFTQVP